MRRILLTCVLAGACVTPAFAQLAQTAQAPSSSKAINLATVVVRGVQSGPGLWKVSKGNHVLWVLGTLSPLPKDITWDSRHVEAVIATAQEMLTGPEVDIKANAGFFGTLALLPSLIGLRNNPNGALLKDVVPPDLYARWSVLKGKYIGGGNKVEQWRPIFAALDLYDAAIGKVGLTDKAVVQKTVNRAAKHAGVKITTPSIEVTIDDPKAAVKEFKGTGLADLDCFRKTLYRIDTDLGAMTARANAWATGDLEALRKLSYTDQMTVCATTISESHLASTRGGTDIDARSQQAWLNAATSALTKNQVTFAMLPIARLLEPDGNLARLRKLGYTVEEPHATLQGATGSNHRQSSELGRYADQFNKGAGQAVEPARQ